MSQAFSLIPRGLKTVSVSNTVTVPMASTTQLLELNLLDGVEKVSFQIDNTVQALDAFVVEGRVHPDASYFTIANAAGDFSAPATASRIVGASGSPVTLAASASARFDLDTSGLYSVRVSAPAAADSAVVTIYASGSASGAVNTNVTLTAGDIQIGAVELKNASTDDRVLVAATGATPAFAVAALPVLANAAAPTIAEGKLAYLSTDLAGAARVLNVAGTALIGKIAIDQTTPGTTNAVQGYAYTSQLTLTRTADGNAYTAGDVIGSATAAGGAVLTFATVGAANGHIIITDTDLLIEVTSIPAGMTSFRLHLYNATPPSNLGDNAAWTFLTNDWATYLGYVDLGAPAVFASGGLFVATSGINKKLKMGASTSLFGYLVTNGGYTPSSAAVKLIRLNVIGV